MGVYNNDKSLIGLTYITHICIQILNGQPSMKKVAVAAITAKNGVMNGDSATKTQIDAKRRIIFNLLD